jgi:phosphopantothenoylcysteine decarboxylase / phosphopantothenate---cysteine ligase
MAELVSDTGHASRRVVLGVAGGIAAYKAIELLRALTEGGHDVTVVPTAAALKFVGEPTWAALSHNRVATNVFAYAEDVPHVRIGQDADVVVVAPATADLIARAAHGLADDLLTNTLLTARCPVLLAPAMHTEMWEHPATVHNVGVLRARGVMVLEPAIGRLTGTDSGKGRLPDPDEIGRVVDLLLHLGHPMPSDLVGRHLLVTAGGTREPLDPVRFLGNRSSGRQGFELATVAATRGARVTVIAANVDLPAPAGSEIVRVGTAEELRVATHAAAKDADAVVMTAAVADFRPAAVNGSKIKKGDADPAPIELRRNPDILAELVALRASGEISGLIAGFAAETGDADGDVLEHGRAKLARKGCDLLVVNAVNEGRAFGRLDNAAVILSSDGSEVEVPFGPKTALAAALCDAIVSRLGS